MLFTQLLHFLTFHMKALLAVGLLPKRTQQLRLDQDEGQSQEFKCGSPPAWPGPEDSSWALAGLWSGSRIAETGATHSAVGWASQVVNHCIQWAPFWDASHWISLAWWAHKLFMNLLISGIHPIWDLTEFRTIRLLSIIFLSPWRYEQEHWKCLFSYSGVCFPEIQLIRLSKHVSGSTAAYWTGKCETASAFKNRLRIGLRVVLHALQHDSPEHFIAIKSLHLQMKTGLTGMNSRFFGLVDERCHLFCCFSFLILHYEL